MRWCLLLGVLCVSNSANVASTTSASAAKASMVSVAELRSSVTPVAMLQKLNANLPVLAKGVAKASDPTLLPTMMKTQMKNTGVLQQILDLKGLKGPNDVDNLAEMLQKAVVRALDGSSPSSTMPGDSLQLAQPFDTSLLFPGRRLAGIFDDIVDFFEDVGCGAFATGAVAGYLASYAWFYSCNSGGQALTTHQKFFQRSVYSDSLLNAVSVKYSACFPPGFGSAAATTMGHTIFVRGAAATTDTNAITTMSLSSSFWSQTRLLLHEMGHSQQYANRGWNIASFGWDYMKAYCEAGFSYSGNSMEVDAENHRALADALMTGAPVAHFKKWRKGNYAGSAGYATQRSESNGPYVSGVLTKTIVLSLNAESQRKDGTYCVRILQGSTQRSQRASATVSGAPWDCVNQPPTRAPTRWQFANVAFNHNLTVLAVSPTPRPVLTTLPPARFAVLAPSLRFVRFPEERITPPPVKQPLLDLGMKFQPDVRASAVTPLGG